MPRFVAKPVTVEAHQFTGTVAFWPEPFRRAVTRHIPGGLTDIQTADGVRPVRNKDWVVCGPGGFSVVHEATFEEMFEEMAANGGLECAAAGAEPGNAGSGNADQRAVAGRRR